MKNHFNSYIIKINRYLLLINLVKYVFVLDSNHSTKYKQLFDCIGIDFIIHMYTIIYQ